MNKFLPISLTIYFIWISIYRNFAGNTPQWDSFYFIFEELLIIILALDSVLVKSGKMMRGFLYTLIGFKGFMLFYEVIKFTSSYEKYIAARTNYMWHFVGTSVILIIILITLIWRGK